MGIKPAGKILAILDSASNVEIGVECQILFIVIFFNCGQVLQFGAHSRYYKGALTQKRSFLVLCTSFRSDSHVGWKNQNKHSTLNPSFDALSKWHEPNINSHEWQHKKCFYHNDLIPASTVNFDTSLLWKRYLGMAP